MRVIVRRHGIAIDSGRLHVIFPVLQSPVRMDTPAAANSSAHATFKLTDFLDVPTLQEIQDSFAAVANVKATITDADGNVLTEPAPTRQFMSRQRAIEQSEGVLSTDPQKEGREYVAPIVVNNQRLGTIRMQPSSTTRTA